MKHQTTNQTTRILAALLCYPTAELVTALPELEGILQAEGWLTGTALRQVQSFMQQLAVQDVLDAQESYVDLFDRTPSLSLHLFEHVHGDSRDRGQALVDLDQIYRAHNLSNASEHTPDYLPMFLEYLSLLPVNDVREALDGVVDILGALRERLTNRKSGYSVLFDAILALAKRRPNPQQLQAAMLADAGDAPTEAALDAAWEEQFALAAASASNSTDCPKAAEMLARMHQTPSVTGVSS